MIIYVSESASSVRDDLEQIFAQMPKKLMGVHTILDFASADEVFGPGLIVGHIEDFADLPVDAAQVWLPVVDTDTRLSDGWIAGHICAPLILDQPLWQRKQAIRRALVQLKDRLELDFSHREVKRKEAEIHTLNEVGSMLTREPHLDTLLELIVSKAREILVCDAGSLYLCETDEDGNDQLSFVVAQNDSVNVPFKAFKMPMTKNSVAGYVALTGKSQNIADAYQIENKPYGFNRSFDDQVGYRTKSMLVAPVVSIEGKCIGVLQLINKKHSTDYIFETKEEFEHESLPYNVADIELVEALGSQAAVAMENARLYRDVQNLLESFMHASVKAIEARDPTTSGHSERVAAYSVTLAQAVDTVGSGIYRRESFDRRELEQLYFAGILHDFGKIGVRENVLVKAKKLYPNQMQAVSDRYLYMRRVLELRYTKMKFKIATSEPAHLHTELFARQDEALANELERIDAAYSLIIESNEPTVLHQDAASHLIELTQSSVLDIDGSALPLLMEDEYSNLAIGRGSLNDEERQEIESHVQHTYNFLTMIPWTESLAQVPEIAYGHHEKLDGTGYPRGLSAPEIALSVRIMTVCDIYDALTAQDRPYKRAVPSERALAILDMDVKAGKIDPDVVRVFIESRAYEAKPQELKHMLN